MLTTATHGGWWIEYRQQLLTVDGGLSSDNSYWQWMGDSVLTTATGSGRWIGYCFEIRYPLLTHDEFPLYFEILDSNEVNER